ncbi:MAG: tetratricopeptide repeat protein [Polyangiaceae bacterium]|nr:tetratricopeptide repeat protein [Polyangiaceae bacterium]
MPRLASLPAVLLAATLIAYTPEVGAQDSAAADVLFQEAKTLMGAGKVAEACPKFQASLELQRTLGTLMNLADCLEQQGRVGSAHRRWEEAVTLAAEQKDDRGTFAEERRKAVASRVPKLVVDAVTGAENLSVAIAGSPVPSSKLGLPMDVDPGKVAITILRGDTVLETREVDLAEGQSLTVKLDLPAISKAHPEKKKSEKPVVEARPEQRIAGFVVLGVGLAGVTAFAVLESVALAKRSEADETGNCVEKNDTALCSPQGFELVEEAGTLAEVGQWVGLGGLAVVGVGITLVLTAPMGEPDDETEPKTTALPWFSPHGGGLMVGGTW